VLSISVQNSERLTECTDFNPPPPELAFQFTLYSSMLRPSELLDVNGRHLGSTFLIGRMTEGLAPDKYTELTGYW
jgi:putative alpha-1,2-mannosidase